MPVALTTYRPPWLPTRRERERVTDSNRGSARERGYDTRWDKARATYLGKHPLCVCCFAHGVAHPAKVVDHIEPHKGDRKLFWDQANWQGLCEWCDKNLKRTIENNWLKHKASRLDLSLDRIIRGWLHPRLR